MRLDPDILEQLTPAQREAWAQIPEPPPPRPVKAPPYNLIYQTPELVDLMKSLCAAAGVRGEEFRRWFKATQPKAAQLEAPPAPRARPSHLRAVR